MVIALGADVVIAFDIGLVQHGITLEAFPPEALWNIGAALTVIPANPGG
jgi:hypothetical protein